MQTVYVGPRPQPPRRTLVPAHLQGAVCPPGCDQVTLPLWHGPDRDGACQDLCGELRWASLWRGEPATPVPDPGTGTPGSRGAATPTTCLQEARKAQLRREGGAISPSPTPPRGGAFLPAHCLLLTLLRWHMCTRFCGCPLPPSMRPVQNNPSLFPLLSGMGGVQAPLLKSISF